MKSQIIAGSRFFLNRLNFCFDRQNTAFKAFGSLVASLCMVPFLPLFRVKEVMYTTIEGAYLFAAELWAPFIPRAGRTPGSRISRDVLAWIMGLGSARLERSRGWFELRELDDMATGMALPAIDDANRHGGLLSSRQISRMLARE